MNCDADALYGSSVWDGYCVMRRIGLYGICVVCADGSNRTMYEQYAD